MGLSLDFWVFLISSFCAIAASGAYIALRVGERDIVRRQLIKEAEGTVTFLFDDTTLIDATATARNMFGRFAQSQDSDYETFLRLFSPTFPSLRKTLESLAKDGCKDIPSPYDPDQKISAEFWNGIARLTYVDKTGLKNSVAPKAAEITAFEAEIETLRAIAEQSPQPIWETEDEIVTWANAAYLKLTREMGHPAHAWPPALLFQNMTSPSVAEPQLTERICIQSCDTTNTRWFDVTSAHRSTRNMHFAVDIDPLVQAETAQKNFVHTISKIFAELSVGLAVFDRSRRLMVFNPALTDLTGLSFDFLSSQPNVPSFLDRLRENRILPERRNYRNWRETVSHLESSAKDGTYCENWDLPDGRVFRVIGRPHPNGSIAYIFEDVSSEIASNRTYRDAIETAQHVLDQSHEAIAVFSPSGEIKLTNAAYRRIWHGDAEYFVEKTNVFEAMRHWQQKCLPTASWSQLRDALCQYGEIKRVPIDLRLENGRRLECSVTAIGNSKTMVKFRTKLRDTPRPNWLESKEAPNIRA